MKPGTLFSLLLLVVSGCTTQSQGANPPTSNSTNPPIVEVRPGLLQIGLVRVNKDQRTVSIPAQVNMREGPVEYLLVTSSGKTHESIFRTEAQPMHVHLAMLLLGATGAGTNAFPTDTAAPLPGDDVTLEVHWPPPAGTQKRPAEHFVFNRTTQAPLRRGNWTYTGSTLFEGTFLAQQEGSIITLFLDPVALINNPRPGREDDENWLPNTKALPPEDSPVDVIIRLQEKTRKPTGPKNKP
jgi:hypothetical protein